MTPGAGSRSLFYLPDAIAPWPALRVAWALDYVIGFFRGDPATALSPTLPAFELPADGSLQYVGRYRQKLVNARIDHQVTPGQTVMARFNYDHFFDTNPNDAVFGTNAPTVARRYTRGSWTTQGNHTAVLPSGLLNEARVAYLHGGPVTLWEPQQLSTTYSRAGAVPFTIGESRSSDIYGRQWQIADTLTRSGGRHTRAWAAASSTTRPVARAASRASQCSGPSRSSTPRRRPSSS